MSASPWWWEWERRERERRLGLEKGPDMPGGDQPIGEFNVEVSLKPGNNARERRSGPFGILWPARAPSYLLACESPWQSVLREAFPDGGAFVEVGRLDELCAWRIRLEVGRLCEERMLADEEVARGGFVPWRVMSELIERVKSAALRQAAATPPLWRMAADGSVREVTKPFTASAVDAARRADLTTEKLRAAYEKVVDAMKPDPGAPLYYFEPAGAKPRPDPGEVTFSGLDFEEYKRVLLDKAAWLMPPVRGGPRRAAPAPAEDLGDGGRAIRLEEA